MTKHQQYNRTVYPIYQRIARVTVDKYWKDYLINLSTDNYNKGNVRIITESAEGTNNITISTSTAKHNNHIIRLAIKDSESDESLVKHSEALIAFLEEYSNLYSGAKSAQLMSDLAKSSKQGLSIRRKTDKSFLLSAYIKRHLTEVPRQSFQKVFRRVHRCMMALPVVKSGNISYDEDGSIAHIDGVVINCDGTLVVDQLKEKTENISGRKRMSFYIEKLLKKDRKKS